MGRYAVVDAAGTVVNVIAYDLADEYEPDEGLALVELADDAPATMGDVIDKRGNVVAAAELPAVEIEASPLDALVAKLVERKVLTAADAKQLAGDAATTAEARK